MGFNSTCPHERQPPADPVPFFANGQVNFKAHDVGWLVAGIFTLITWVASIWLILKHLTYYTCPPQQRHIVRMLFMPPIYATISFAGYLFYTEAIYYETIRDCYEAVVITSFFYLLLQYVGDTRAEQHEVFRNVKLEKWFWPMGWWKYRPSGLHFSWLMKIAILQYAIVRPLCTIFAVVLQALDLYCMESWMPNFGHIWISLAISVSVTVAMYCIIQFYLPIQEELKPYSPVLKFLAVKSVVFLTFWQSTFLSILAFFKVIHATDHMTSADVQAGINALCETFEMVIFSLLHIKAFTYIIYRPEDRDRKTSKGRALLDVLDFRDWARQMGESSRYVYAKSRGKEMKTHVDDIRADKHRHLVKALGRERSAALAAELATEKAGDNVMAIPWKDPPPPASSNYGTGYDEEKSMSMGTGLDEEEEASLSYAKRGMAHPELQQYHRTHDDAGGDLDDDDEPPRGVDAPAPGGRHRAWWRALRERISGSHYEDAHQEVADVDDHDRDGADRSASPLLDESPLSQIISRGSGGHPASPPVQPRLYDSWGPRRATLDSPVTAATQEPQVLQEDMRSASRFALPPRSSSKDEYEQRRQYQPAPGASFEAPMHASERASWAPQQAKQQQQQQQQQPAASVSPPSWGAAPAPPPVSVSRQQSRPTSSTSTGPKGRKIDIRIPEPLSPARYPYSAPTGSTSLDANALNGRRTTLSSQQPPVVQPDARRQVRRVSMPASASRPAPPPSQPHQPDGFGGFMVGQVVTPAERMEAAWQSGGRSGSGGGSGSSGGRRPSLRGTTTYDRWTGEPERGRRETKFEVEYVDDD